MSALSRAFGVSRPTVYAASATASEVLEQHFDESDLGGSPVCVEVDEAQLQRAVVALRVMAPNALRPIEDLLPILYPGVRISYSTIQHIVSGAEGNAAAFNAKADLSAITASAREVFPQAEQRDDSFYALYEDEQGASQLERSERCIKNCVTGYLKMTAKRRRCASSRQYTPVSRRDAGARNAKSSGRSANARRPSLTLIGLRGRCGKPKKQWSTQR